MKKSTQLVWLIIFVIALILVLVNAFTGLVPGTGLAAVQPCGQHPAARLDLLGMENHRPQILARPVLLLLPGAGALPHHAGDGPFCLTLFDTASF